MALPDESATAEASWWRGQQPQQQQQRQEQGLPVLRNGGQLSSLPFFSLGPQFVLFPGELTQLRIFEKRYQRLMREALAQGGCFGFPLGGLGITACVRRYFLEGSEFYVVIEGGARFKYEPPACRVLPGSFGLNTCDVSLARDQEVRPEEVEAVMQDAGQLVQLVRQGVVTAQSAQVSASSMFASALHFAGSMPGGAPAAAASAAVAAEQEAAGSGARAGQQQGRAAGGPPPLDVQHAEALSLYLAAYMPVDHEVRQQWFRSFSTGARLRDQVARLLHKPNVALATGSEVSKLEAGHPLRALLGL
mmetsp:Transcript_29941/g.66263  ORF Transcript_29941/g.66263 Transcript_29941/m.66263 type:complete len:305 (+) Transcript_29941:1136-2050(+)